MLKAALDRTDGLISSGPRGGLPETPSIGPLRATTLPALMSLWEELTSIVLIVERNVEWLREGHRAARRGVRLVGLKRALAWSQTRAASSIVDFDRVRDALPVEIEALVARQKRLDARRAENAAKPRPEQAPSREPDVNWEQLQEDPEAMEAYLAAAFERNKSSSRWEALSEPERELFYIDQEAKALHESLYFAREWAAALEETAKAAQALADALAAVVAELDGFTPRVVDPFEDDVDTEEDREAAQRFVIAFDPAVVRLRECL